MGAAGAQLRYGVSDNGNRKARDHCAVSAVFFRLYRGGGGGLGGDENLAIDHPAWEVEQQLTHLSEICKSSAAPEIKS